MGSVHVIQNGHLIFRNFAREALKKTYPSARFKAKNHDDDEKNETHKEAKSGEWWKIDNTSFI